MKSDGIPGKLGRHKVEKTMKEVKHMNDKKFNATLIEVKVDPKPNVYSKRFRSTDGHSGFALVPVPQRRQQPGQNFPVVRNPTRRQDQGSTTVLEWLTKMVGSLG